MSIDCMGNLTKVKTPDGHTGKLLISRRERRLVSDGDQHHRVNVLGTDGLRREFIYSDLVEIIPEKPKFCEECGHGL